MIYIGLGTAVVYLLLKYVAPIFAPFIIAVFLTIFIEPLVLFLQKRGRLPRAAAVGVALLAVFGALGLVVTFAVARLISELLHLSTFLPQYVANIKSVVLSIQTRVESYYFTLPADVLDFINGKIAGSAYSLDSILQKARFFTGKLLNFLLQLVSSVPIWVILIVISAIATYFMSKDKRLIVNYWLKVLPEPWGRKSLDIAKDIFQAIISYVRAQMILISITMLQSLIGLYIIDAPYALLMGLIIGLADLIPVLGPSSIYLPWITWEFITGDTAFAVKLLILYAVVLIVRQVLETKIVSSSMGLHPLATLMAMYVGLQLLGPLGVIAGPLFIITLKALASAGLIGWKES
ncbi:MAG: sporulation integral membrane protein YtvI [Eubacteriales bacterium]